MAIKLGFQYDNSLASIVGRSTMQLFGEKDSSNEYPTHALVFLLTGVSSRWKQTVGDEFAASSYSAFFLSLSNFMADFAFRKRLDYTLELLRRDGHQDFVDPSDTCKFLRMVNNTFDCLNSRCLFTFHFKRPLKPETATKIFDFFD
ncbi:hypothetical protein ABEB36_006787 [Hypothenemus hampei]|uniref:Uncharacterized protein n=1 Tax=Hypothenemus hampei TaxID=57062 RepID=A0ABD1ES92_HYPHA